MIQAHPNTADFTPEFDLTYWKEIIFATMPIDTYRWA